MSDAVFLAENISENDEVEAKLALGRDGKGELPKAFWESYSAFANSYGGVILLGVRETAPMCFEGEGIENVDKVETDLWNQLNDGDKVSTNLLQRQHVERIAIREGCYVLAVRVPRAPRSARPVYIGRDFFRGSYKRNHSGDYRCSKEEVERMLAERMEESRDARILPHYGLSDLSMDTLSSFRQRLAVIKPDHPYNDLEVIEFLRAVGGWKRNRETGEDGLTIAGLLMFGTTTSIRDAVPHYFLDYRELPVSGSKTEWTDRLTPDGTWSGNLYDFYRQVITRLFRDLRVPLNIKNDQREDDTPLHKALRECLVNSLVHADYSGRASIMVVKAPDYFGFRNPGHMRISIDDALQGGKSDCRNRSLQLMFSLIGLGEQAGSGIPRILKNWDALSYRQPELWEDNAPDSTLMRLRTVSLLPQEAIDTLNQLFGDGFDALSSNEKLALVTAEVEGSVSNVRLQQVCRDHPSDITKMLQKLVTSSMLYGHGAGRATTYSLYGSEQPDLATPIISSPHKGMSSSHKEASSLHSEPSSSHKEEEACPLIIENLEAHADLWEMAQTVREKKRCSQDEIRSAVAAVCAEHFLTADQLGSLLDRNASSLRSRYLTPMTQEDILEYRYPLTPNHENQAYHAILQQNEL